MNKEIWKDIPNYEGLYQASNLGNIKNIRTNKLLKCIESFGYLRVTLYKDKKPKTYSVHRLIAITFIPNFKKYSQINHKNENRKDNRVENLEWCTASYNINYGNRNKKVSEKLLNNKTNSKKVKCIETGIIYSSTREIERLFGYNHTNISACCNKKRKTRGGFHWEYI